MPFFETLDERILRIVDNRFYKRKGSNLMHLLNGKPVEWMEKVSEAHYQVQPN